MKNQKDLPKPQTDLPLPEKEIPPKIEARASIFTSKFFILFVVVSSLIAFLVGGFILGNKNSIKTACTLEAKICPDGSSFGRTGPKCEFAACPKEHCGGNIANAKQCSAGYHCQLEKIADLGGTCVKD